MKPLVYKGLRKNLNRSEWVSSDEIKQSYSQIRLLSVENDTYAWVPIEDGTLCRGSEAKDTLGQRIYEKDHIEFDCKSIQDTPMVGEVYYSVDKYQWRCKAINQQDTTQHDAVLDFDLAFVLNNGKVKVIGNKLERYEKERTRVFIPYWGYAFIPSDALLMARIRRDAFKGNKIFNQWARSYYETTMQGVPI